MEDEARLSKQAETKIYSWYQVWGLVWFSPIEKTYRKLIADPKAKLIKGGVWVFISALVAALVPLLVYWISGGEVIHDDLVDAGIFGYAGLIVGVIGAVIVYFVSVYIFAWIAARLGGEGSVDQFGYLLGAIAAVGIILDSLLEGLIPFALLNLGARLLVGLYEYILLTLGIRTAFILSWWRALLTATIPIVIAFVLIYACAFFASF